MDMKYHGKSEPFLNPTTTRWFPCPTHPQLVRNIIRISEKLLARSLEGRNHLKKKMQIFFVVSQPNVPVMTFHSLSVLML
jgi:hypothetical protein